MFLGFPSNLAAIENKRYLYISVPTLKANKKVSTILLLLGISRPILAYYRNRYSIIFNSLFFYIPGLKNQNINNRTS